MSGKETVMQTMCLKRSHSLARGSRTLVRSKKEAQSVIIQHYAQHAATVEEGLTVTKGMTVDQVFDMLMAARSK
jgi:hypothetical protein